MAMARRCIVFVDESSSNDDQLASHLELAAEIEQARGDRYLFPIRLNESSLPVLRGHPTIDVGRDVEAIVAALSRATGRRLGGPPLWVLIDAVRDSAPHDIHAAVNPRAREGDLVVVFSTVPALRPIGVYRVLVTRTMAPSTQCVLALALPELSSMSRPLELAALIQRRMRSSQESWLLIEDLEIEQRIEGAYRELIGVHEQVRDLLLSGRRAEALIFLSFHSDDRAAVRKIASDLERSGLPVWFDETRLTSGEDWRESIEAAIKQASLFIPFISRASETAASNKSSLWREWRLAEERAFLLPPTATFILPVALEKVDPFYATVPELFRRIQWFELYGRASTAELAEVIQSVYRRKTRIK
jgi:hypothetical protein